MKRLASILTMVQLAYSYSPVGYEGMNKTLVCNLSHTPYPMWDGPEDDPLDPTKRLRYNYLGKRGFSPSLGDKKDRLSWDTNDKDIIIRNLQLKDGGIYTCQDKDAGLYSQHLHVRVMPNNPQILDTDIQNSSIVRGTEDQTVDLTCISSGGYPAPYLKWFRNNVSATNIMNSTMTESTHGSTKTVTIHSTFHADRGYDKNDFICQSSYDPPPDPLSSAVVLYLSLKPSTPVISGDLTVTEQSETTLVCSTGNARPAGNISWSLQGIPSASAFQSMYDKASETYRMTSSYTTRTLVRADNGGEVACKVGHEAMNTSLITVAALNVLFVPESVQISGNRIVAANGSNNLILKCSTSSANPVSNITWTASGTPHIISSDAEKNGLYGGKIREQEITITPNRGMDGNAVSCTAEHYLLHLGVAPTEQVNLDLKYSPLVNITDPSPKTATEGDNGIVLQCSANSKPASDFTWFKSTNELTKSNGTQASNTFNYVIATANRSHYGDYQCCASNEVDKACSEYLRLQILFPPLDVQLLGNRVIAANGTNELQLTCETGTAFPVAVVVLKIGTKVYISDQIIDTNGTYGGIVRKSTIILKPTRDMDGKKILCEASNNVSSNPAVKEDTLNITYGPYTTVLSDSPKIVIEGQSDIGLTCSAESKPPSRFKWYKAGDPKPLISGTGTPSSNTLNYTIATVNRTHAGNYSCTAENGITNTNNSDGEIQLIVQYPPDVTVTTVNATVKDEYVDVHCTAAGVPSNYTFSVWRQTWPGSNAVVRDQLISTNKSIPSKRTLRLTSLTYQDTGVYACEASNGVNNLMMTGSDFLLVKSEPVLANSSRSYKIPARLNTKFRITMAVYSNDGIITGKLVSNNTGNDVNASIAIVDDPVVRLQVYGREIETGGYSLILSHVITRQEEFGNYTLDISNNFGATDVRFEVVAEGKPCSPLNLTVAKSTSNSVTLSWIGCFNGGREQTFVIQHSTDGLKWTNISDVKEELSNSQQPLNTTVGSLQPNTLYYFMLFAYNDLGRSDNTTVINITTKAKDDDFLSKPNIGLIAGGAVGGLIAALIVILIVLFLFRRHKKSRGSPKKALLKENGRGNEVDEKDDLPEINLNPMYESAGPQPSTAKSSGVYSEVKKQKPQQTVSQENTDVYAKVLKPRDITSAPGQKTGGTGTTSDLYSVPIKTQKGKQKKKEEKKQKKDKQTKSKKDKEEMAYEDTDTFNHEPEPKKIDNVYENPACLTDDEKPKRIKNEDGLIYVDVELPQQKGMSDRKPVIHGLEDRTDYADIQFGKVGEPAPESDEENDKTKTE